MNLRTLNLQTFTIETGFGASSRARWFAELRSTQVKASSELLSEVRAQIDQGCFDTLVVVSSDGGSSSFEALPQKKLRIENCILRTDFTVAASQPGGKYIDFEEWNDLSTFAALVDEKNTTLFVLDRVLEKIWDVRPLLSTLRELLQLHKENTLLVCHTDAEACASELHPSGHREWSALQMASLLESAGMQISSTLTSVPQNSAACIQLARCSTEFFAAFLSGQQLPPPSISNLLLTTEHLDFSIAGGIGSYVAEIERIIPSDELGVLLCPFSRQQSRVSFSNPRLILLRHFFDEEKLLELPIQEAAWCLVEHVLFYYPHVRRIEFQDYLGIGVRIVQAKEAGLLKQDISLVVHGHGAQVYLEAGSGSWLDADRAETSMYEKISIERADQALFPTHFIHGLYEGAGIKISSDRISFIRYPFTFAARPTECSYQQLDTIIFYGRPSRMKGYLDLLRALMQLRPLALLNLEEVIFLGRLDPAERESAELLTYLRQEVKVTFQAATRKEARDVLADRRSHALCVLPYLGDNHPFCVLEAIEAGCSLLSYAAGGIPEMLPARFNKETLCAPNVTSLVEAIQVRFAQSPVRRQELALNLFRDTREAQQLINKSVVDRHDPLSPVSVLAPSILAPSASADFSPITAIVPAYNVPTNFLYDLCFALQMQLLRPYEVIFVDDGSDLQFADHYELVLKNSGLSYRIIRSQTNQGPAAARNRALSEVRTPLFANIDADDIPLPRFLSDIVSYFSRNPQIMMVTSYLASFADGENWKEYELRGYMCRPLGEGYALGHVRNCLGHANTGYRTDDLRCHGGWDESDGSMWEDWALFLKLASLGLRVGIIPRIGALLRLHSTSLRCRSPFFPAVKRLARTLSNERMPLFDALRIEAMLQRMLELENEYAALKNHSAVQVQPRAAPEIRSSQRMNFFRATGAFIATCRNSEDEWT